MSTAEPLIRTGFFLGVFALMALWEALAPRRHQAIGRWERWPSNLGIVVIDPVVLRVLFPTAAVGMAMFAEDRGWGLFNVLSVPGRAAVPASVVLLDFAIYSQHVAFHAVPPLWRLHPVHHADPAVDVTTGGGLPPPRDGVSVVNQFAFVG